MLDRALSAPHIQEAKKSIENLIFDQLLPIKEK